MKLLSESEMSKLYDDAVSAITALAKIADLNKLDWYQICRIYFEKLITVVEVISTLSEFEECFSKGDDESHEHQAQP